MARVNSKQTGKKNARGNSKSATKPAGKVATKPAGKATTKQAHPPKKKKQLSELTIMDDFMFYACMQNSELVRPFIERILGRRIGKIVEKTPQAFSKESYESKGVRMDVLCKDKKCIYNLEAQNERKKGERKRTRIYQWHIDLSDFKEGMDYSQVRDSYIIFVCRYDLEKEGKLFYKFAQTRTDGSGKMLGDRANTIFVNINGSLEGASKNLKNLILYLRDGIPRDDYTRKLEDEVKKVKEKEEWIMRYHWMVNHDSEVREEGREEGRKEGREEGRKELKAEFKKLIKSGADLREIAEAVGMKREEVERLSNSLSPTVAV